MSSVQRLYDYRKHTRWSASHFLSILVFIGTVTGGCLVATALNPKPVQHPSARIPVRLAVRSIGRVIDTRLKEDRLKILLGTGGASSSDGTSSTEVDPVKALERIRKAATASGGDYFVEAVRERASDLVAALADHASVVASETAKQQKHQSLEDQQPEWARIAQDWLHSVSKDLAADAASESISKGDPNFGTTIGTKLEKALDVPTLASAVAKQMESEANPMTMSQDEREAAGKDLSARLAWGAAAVLFVGLWVACIAIALWQIRTLLLSHWRKWILVTLATAGAGGFLLWYTNAIVPGKQELLGPLVNLLDEQSRTCIVPVSRLFNGLSAFALVVLLSASIAITKETGQAGDEAVLGKMQLEGLRITFNVAAALLMTRAIEVAALYGWAAAAFEPSSGALADAALLSAGFVGALFSAALVVVYLPAASILRHRLTPGAPELVAEGFDDSTFQQIARLLQALTPLLAALPVSALVTLLQ